MQRELQVSDVMQRVRSYFAGSPAQPDWLAGIPLVGARLALGWDRLVQSGGNLRTVLASYRTNMPRLIVVRASSLADSVTEIVLAIAVGTMFWARGDSIVAVLRETLRRLGGVPAEQTLDVAASAMRGVAGSFRLGRDHRALEAGIERLFEHPGGQRPVLQRHRGERRQRCECAGVLRHVLVVEARPIGALPAGNS